MRTPESEWVGSFVFSERIKELRIMRKLSQEELGIRLGVSKQAVSNWENGNVTPSMDMIQCLINFFHIVPNYLFGYDDRPMIDVTGLTEEEIGHIMMFVDDLKAAKKKR